MTYDFPIITHLMNGCQGQPMVSKDKQWGTFKVLMLSTTLNENNTSKYASNFKLPIITH